MNRPEVYHKANYVQRHDAAHVIKRFSSTIQWRYDGRDSLIDVGSGSGDVLMDFVYPLMPSNFQRIVCSDINPQIVKYAKSHYGHIEKSEFKVLDIETNNDLSPDLKEQFDHVMSFYTLMWVQNLRRGLRNIYQLLRREGGDCLLVSLDSHPIFDGYKHLSQMDRWSKYMKDVDTMFTPLLNSIDPAKEYIESMKEAGFSNFHVEVQNKVFHYDSLEMFRANMVAVNPYLHRMPPLMHDDYIKDLLSETIRIMGLNPGSFKSNSEFPVPYKLVIVYGRKSPLDVYS